VVLVAFALALGLALAVVGCGGGDTADSPGEGRRIGVMAPAAAEMLEALGALDRVVAAGDFVRNPVSLRSLPQLGAYNAPNVERLVELRVDLLVTTESEAAQPTHRRLEELGVQVLPLDTSTYDGVFDSLGRLGRTLGLEARSREIERDIRGRLLEIRRRADGRTPRRVLFVVGRDPLYVAGPGSHVDEMIALVAGVNVAADTNSPYPRLSMEAVLERLPEVIVDTSSNLAGAAFGRSNGSWAEWSFLPAVRDGRVYQVHPERLVIPGMRLAEMTLLMGKLVQPEVFGEARDDELGGPEEVPGAAGG
jgi:iron complex transport system substrate-binding protein